MARAAALAALLGVGALLLGVTSGTGALTQATKLVGTVGPGFTITLRDAQGASVTRLDPGTYEIEVRDLSDIHNFHLRGPGVDRATSVEGTGTETWTVTLREGTYTYLCDPHPTSMRGTFTVGAPSATPPSIVTPRSRLVLTSGPGFTITLRTAQGADVKQVKVGTYTVLVRDRSRIHNARLVAPGFNRATTLPFVGAQTWRVALTRPGTERDDKEAEGWRRGRSPD
ncbi:MAG: plastocyanin/azurin family copper-binding protein [Gaiellaceae bacterium]|nr:plastocyanin/azurin family copper-binding protein [Gaiellaceae bacterium]